MDESCESCVAVESLMRRHQFLVGHAVDRACSISRIQIVFTPAEQQESSVQSNLLARFAYESTVDKKYDS